MEAAPSSPTSTSLESLSYILMNTYNSDTSYRAQAEDALAQYLCTPGSLYSLLMFLGSTQVNRDLRQAAGIAVKNKIKKFWTLEEHGTIGDDEKELVRNSILQLLIAETDSSIRQIISDIVYNIIQSDYIKGRWPGFLPTVLANITSQDGFKIYNALLALRKIAKFFEFKQQDMRGSLDEIIQTSFPILQSLVASLLENNEIEAAQIMRLCLKVFYSSTVYALPQVQGIDVNFWFNSLAHIIQKKLPEASEGLEPTGQPTSIEERTSWPWWKLKKWAVRIVNQFIQRYGNPRTASELYQAFANFFRANIAPLMLGPIMNNLALKASGGFITDNIHRLCLSYMMSAVEMSPTFKLIKPHMDFVLFQAIFQTLCLSKEDIQLFTDDPVEFVRRIHDPMDDWMDPRTSAINLLQTLARYRAKDVLPRLLPFMESVLQTYGETALDSRNYIAKDGVLVAFATISKVLLDSDKYKGHLEPFVRNHVIPEFSSPVSFLRYRACWVVEYLDHDEWKLPDTVQVLLQGLLQGLRDPAVPVQAAAACSMKQLIDSEGAVDLLRPYLQEIVSEYFRIMNEVENEAILGALQGLVESFGDEIEPIATTMVSHLINTFEGFSAAGSDDDEAAFNATQCLDTVACIIEAIEGREQTMSQLEAIILPLLSKLINSGENCFEYLDNALQILNMLMYTESPISPGLYSICGPLLGALDAFAIDYICDIMIPLLHFMTKDMASFLSGVHENVPFPTMLLNIIQKQFVDDTTNYELDCKAAATLLTCFITNSRPLMAIGSQIGDILRMILTRLEITKTANLRHKLLDSVMAIIYYDPYLFLSIISSNAAAGDLLFQTLFDNAKVAEITLSQKLIVLSFSTLLTVDTNTLSDYIKSNLTTMFRQVITELALLKAEEAARQRSSSDDDDDDDDGDDDDDFDDGDNDGENAHSKDLSKFGRYSIPDNGYDEDEDCINAEDEEYLQYIRENKNNSSDLVKTQKYLAGEPVDDDEEDDEDIDTAMMIENIDCLKYFFDCLQASSIRDHLQNSLSSSVEDVAMFQSLLPPSNE